MTDISPPVSQVETTKKMSPNCKYFRDFSRNAKNPPTEALDYENSRLGDSVIHLSVSLDRPCKRAYEIPFQIYHRFHKGEYGNHTSKQCTYNSIECKDTYAP